MYADVVQQSIFVWSSVSSRKQSGNYKNHVSAAVSKSCILLSPLSLMIFIITTKLLFAVTQALSSIICFEGICKALLHSWFSLHLSGSMFILQEIE